MLTQNKLDAIVYEYQHGGVKSSHGLTRLERKSVLKYLFRLPTYCSNCHGKGEVYVGNGEDFTIEPCVR